MVVKLLRFNSWYAFACGVFCLMVAGMIVDQSLMALGLKPQQIIHDQTYLFAVSFVRIVGIALFAYAMAVRLVLRQGFDPEDLRSFFALLAVGAVLWGGMFIFVIFTKSVLLAAITGLGLLEWLSAAALLLFEYKKPQSWEAVRPDEKERNNSDS
jgi:hypothetical protein